MALRIAEHAALTDVGRQRHTNEDSYLDSPPFFVVADGMGGAQAGEVASQTAVETFAEPGEETGSAEDQLAALIHAANRRIYELAQADDSRAGMGTTCTAVKVGDGEVSIGHVGDSRAYRLREGELERLTQDHSLVEELLRQGKLTPEEAEKHPQRSIITRALGPEGEVEVETCTYRARAGDLYLLCSDGLTGMVSEERVAELLRGAGGLDQAARELIEEANRNGGRDNITVVAFRLDGDEEQASAPDAEQADSPPEIEQTVVGVDAAPVREAAARAKSAAATPAAPSPPAAGSPARPAPPESASRPAPAPPRARPAQVRRPTAVRRAATALIALVVLAAVAVGLYEGSRQFFFLGTDEHGLVTLYRGLPYELPLGLTLYEHEYSSAVPSASLRRLGCEEVVEDHKLRARGDAVDLIRQAEAARLDRCAGPR